MLRTRMHVILMELWYRTPSNSDYYDSWLVIFSFNTAPPSALPQNNRTTIIAVSVVLSVSVVITIAAIIMVLLCRKTFRQWKLKSSNSEFENKTFGVSILLYTNMQFIKFKELIIRTSLEPNAEIMWAWVSNKISTTVSHSLPWPTSLIKS